MKISPYPKLVAERYDISRIESEGWVSCGRDYSAEAVEAFCVNAGFEHVRVTSQQLEGSGWDALALTCRKPSL
jgi:hypothetical protein